MAEDSDGFDDSDAEDPGEEDQTPLVKRLRGELRARDKELGEARSARRELAFVRAGIDTSTKLGALFAKSYEGDITDLDALKKEAIELGLLQAPDTQEEEDGDDSSQERSSLARGGVSDDGTGVDPRQTARQKAEKALADGAPFEQAGGVMVAELAKAAMNGDARVVIKGQRY